MQAITNRFSFLFCSTKGLVLVAIAMISVVTAIWGTLSGNKQARIVKIDEYYVELYPIGEMIYIENWDSPGLIGNLGTVLGKHGVNIAAMTFGRDKPGGKAISVLSVDSPVSAELAGKIKQLENILTIKGIRI